MVSIYQRIVNKKRIVIKVGSSTLTHENGSFNLRRIESLTRVLSDLKSQGKEIMLVTSGAIAAGVGKLGMKRAPVTTMEKQAVAAVGQCELMSLYSKLFSEYSQVVSQILLTRDVLEDEKRKGNVINTFETLFSLGVLPIINENDTVSVEEILYGDNDTLSAAVAKITKADLLIILTDIDGLYDDNPHKNKNAKRIEVVKIIDEKIKSFADGKGSDRGTGGMATKIIAAEIAVKAGTDMIIACGNDPKIIYDILEGKPVGTLFLSEEE